jgi:hypothetical protein
MIWRSGLQPTNQRRPYEMFLEKPMNVMKEYIQIFEMLMRGYLPSPNSMTLLNVTK